MGGRAASDEIPLRGCSASDEVASDEVDHAGAAHDLRVRVRGGKGRG